MGISEDTNEGLPVVAGNYSGDLSNSRPDDPQILALIDLELSRSMRFIFDTKYVEIGSDRRIEFLDTIEDLVHRITVLVSRTKIQLVIQEGHPSNGSLVQECIRRLNDELAELGNRLHLFGIYGETVERAEKEVPDAVIHHAVEVYEVLTAMLEKLDY